MSLRLVRVDVVLCCDARVKYVLTNEVVGCLLQIADSAICL